jgi:hypothetical protein
MKRLLRWIEIGLVLAACAGCGQVPAPGPKPGPGLWHFEYLDAGHPGSQLIFLLLVIGLCAGLAIGIWVPRWLENNPTRRRRSLSLPGLSNLLHHELALLVVENSEETQPGVTRITLKQAVTKIGRSVHNDISFPNEKAVSRSHAMIEYQGGGFRISEMLSIQDGRMVRPTYGTFINGVPISGNLVFLKSGDEIQLGKHLRLRFHSLVKSQDARPGREDNTFESETR